MSARGLSLASLMASAADPFVAAFARAIAQRTGARVDTLAELPWSERAARIERGDVAVAWMCGLYYARARARGVALDAVAAPVFAAPRHAGRAVYFADLVVRADAPFASFADLHGAAFAFNDPTSFSGLTAVRQHLDALGEREGWFGRAIETGSHDASLRAVAAGLADVASIDNTVLDAIARAEPARVAAVRTVASLGPWPSPPLVVARGLDAATRAAVLDVALALDAATLAAGGLARFEPTDDAAYEPIRRSATAADRAPLVARPSSDARPDARRPTRGPTP